MKKTIFDNKKYRCSIVEHDGKYHVYLEQKFSDILALLEHGIFSDSKCARDYAESFKGVYSWSVC